MSKWTDFTDRVSAFVVYVRDHPVAQFALVFAGGVIVGAYLRGIL